MSAAQSKRATSDMVEEPATKATYLPFHPVFLLFLEQPPKNHQLVLEGLHDHSAIRAALLGHPPEQ